MHKHVIVSFPTGEWILSSFSIAITWNIIIILKESIENYQMIYLLFVIQEPHEVHI